MSASRNVLKASAINAGRKTPALQAYNAAFAVAYAEYVKEIAAADKTYDELTVPAQRAYDAAIGPALAAYIATRERAERKYIVTISPARWAYDNEVARAETPPRNT